MVSRDSFSGYPPPDDKEPNALVGNGLNVDAFTNRFKEVMIFNPILFDCLMQTLRPIVKEANNRKTRARDMLWALENLMAMDGSFRVASEVTGKGFAMANLVNRHGGNIRLSLRMSVKERATVVERPSEATITEISLADVDSGESIDITHLDSPDVIKALNDNWPSAEALQKRRKEALKDGPEGEAAAITRFNDLRDAVTRPYQKSYSKGWYLHHDGSPVGDMLRQLTGFDLSYEQTALFGVMTDYMELTPASLAEDIDNFSEEALRDVTAGLLMKRGTINGADKDHISALEIIRDFARDNNQCLMDLCPLSRLEPDHSEWPDKNLLCSGPVMSIYIDGAKKKQVKDMVSELLRNGVVFEQISDEAKAAIQGALTRPEGSPKRKPKRM